MLLRIVLRSNTGLIPIRFQDETNSLVFLAFGSVAHSSRIHRIGSLCAPCQKPKIQRALASS
jgi:hypothetical protein